MPPSTKLRVGIVDYLNAWPLAWGFLTGTCDERFEPIYLPPAEVASELGAGRLDIGLIPSIEAQRLDGLAIVPGLCVASTHEVRSVILVSKCPIEEIRSVALDRNSRTSAALIEILLEARCGVRVQTSVAAADVESMLAVADAALIIGDPALAVDRKRYRIWDLAAEWRGLTGHPFVFAVWAVRERFAESGLGISAALAASLELGLEGMEAVIARATSELGLGDSTVRSYLTDNLSYRLDEEALEGLTAFYERAAKLGLSRHRWPLRFLAPAD